MGTGQSLRASTELFCDLLRRDPASAERWADLGTVFALSNRSEAARICFTRASILGKYNPDVWTSAGDFYLTHGEVRQGLGSLTQALALTDQLDDAVFSRFVQRKIPTAEVIAFGLPSRRAAAAYLRYLLSEHSDGEAAQVWRYIRDGGAPPDESLAIEYSNALLHQDRIAEAASAWASTRTEPEYGLTQYAYNGSFEREFSGALLDWGIDTIDHVEVSRAREPTGARCLQLRFDGEANTDYHHARQFVVLPPGTYRFEALVRSEGLSTDEGPFLRVRADASMRPFHAELGPFLGTVGWHAVRTTFTVARGMGLGRIEIVRRPSLRLDNRIAGTLWLDEVSLRRVL
jgi:hypothetical protein